MSGGVSTFLKTLVVINAVVMVASSGLLLANPALNFFCKTRAITRSERAESKGLRYECSMQAYTQLW